MTHVLPGWYDDSAGMIRWWDGQTWTDHVQQPHDPVVIPMPATTPPPTSTTTSASAPGSDGTLAGIGHGESKVPFFGARKAAEQLAARVAELEGAAARYGHLELLDLEAQRAGIAADISNAHRELHDVQTSVAAAASELERARLAIIDVRQTAGIQELGLYDYDHPAEGSADLATKLEVVRLSVKQMIRDKTAATATTGFTFNNSVSKGTKFVNDMTKILLRAYNAEAENCVKTTRAGNLATAQKRLTTAADQIARQGSMIDLRISPRFHGLRLEEISLANRHLAALQVEKERERERREELREQRKAEQELEREQERLRKEQSHYELALEALRLKGDHAGVARMEAKLEDVQRAIDDVDYRAANIRAGYVYVISNKGSFGDSVVKIGMTRRLEPMDRVRELGDASVPFRFDVHALFFAHDAVGVEAMLHRRFAQQRVNQVNFRREFFYVTPQQVLDVLHQESVEIVEFRLEVESEEWSISRSAREARIVQPSGQSRDTRPLV
ncbi:DUF4041 domain-containing protein [Frigoribacterium faeni]|uniref:DUF4041 domain-containing protein n=1 Tax=Frigoribacterium faeni TaxID=145483 RepID=UPI00141BD044|nr:DUF4041 domain-containing protein [Frigoribacterium faeni]NIJ05074.1 uncharacterized protein YlxW (UPF0749 family) [Frigoribacterium faeni]